MTTSKAVLALCLVGAAVAAPQLRLGGLRSVSSVSSVTNQNEVVTSVVSALTPSIAAAVEEALAAQAAAEAAQLEAQRRAAAAAAAAAAKANKADTPDEPAKYNFEYKIADDQAQVYITQTEGRDGDDLTGTYSYVDSRGALVTVNYEAGPEGYSETRDEELGFVEIRSQPARVAPAPPVRTDQATLIQKILAILQPQIGSAVSSAIQARRAEAARLEAERRAAAEAQAAAAAEAARLEAERRAAAEAARLEAERRAAAEAARIEAERRAAEEAARLEAERRAAAEAAAAAAAAAAASSSNSIDIFGNGGYNVRVQTPDFKIEY